MTRTASVPRLWSVLSLVPIMYSAVLGPLVERLDRIEEAVSRLPEIERVVTAILARRPVQQWYTVKEFAREVGRAPFTVRQWCLHGRIRADKRACGRGTSQEWIVSHDELLRFRQEGLLPPAEDRGQGSLRNVRDEMAIPSSGRF